MKNFVGDLQWIHDREGHAGKPYWPGGMSGVTLDPGFDLGHAESDTLKYIYSDLMTSSQLDEAISLKGVTGNAAKDILPRLKDLSRFRISRSSASDIFPKIVVPFWEGLLKRWPSISSAPAAVQTALLSLVYNRGYNNSKLEVLTESINRNDWFRVGDLISAMQQNHPLAGIRTRRRLEGQLILADSVISS
jgi:hypothetical protein